jgi:hypothetical protein
LIIGSANVSSLNEALKKAPVSHVSFFLCLTAFEVLLFKFWVNGTLEQILIQMGIVSLLTFLTGRKALWEVMQRRHGKSSTSS